MLQNQPPQTETDFVAVTGANWVCQEFVLPADYIRGTAGEQIIPDLTGVHVFAHVADGRNDAVGIEYRVQRYLFGTGWITEGEGDAILADADGDIWLRIAFEKSIKIDENSLDGKWRFCLRPRAGSAYHLPVEYDGNIAYLPGYEQAISLNVDSPKAFDKNAAYRDLIIHDSPSLFWRLNEPSGTVAEDATVNNRDGIYGSGVTLNQTGLLTGDLDKAAAFDGTANAKIDSGYAAYVNGTQRSFEFWLNPTDMNASRIIFGSGHGAFRVTLGGTDLGFEPRFGFASAVWAGAATLLLTGSRHHLVLTFNEPTDTTELFIDGVSLGTRALVTDWGPTPGNFRFSGNSADSYNGIADEIAVYESILTAESIRAHFEAGIDEVPFTIPSILLWDSSDGIVYFSEQQGVESIWLSRPNPLATVGFVRATTYDETPIQIGGEDTSLLFRLIGAVADSGTDFLGNAYRSAIRRNSGAAVESVYGEESDSHWFSKPNPSRFAVETLYFDNRDDDGNAQVLDHVYVDAVTPNVYFNVYHSDEGEPGEDASEWEERIWHHVPKQFKMVKQENHVLPNPITTKYVAIEFSHLQPRPYSPGFFQQPIRYKKHPRWVLDYFLARTELDQFTSKGSGFIPRQVGVTYSAIDLAYNYRLDDLAQEPDEMILIDPSLRNQAVAELSQGDNTAMVDTAALDQLKLAFAEFQRHPAFNPNVRYLLSDSIQTIVDNYPVELPDLLPQEYDVSALRNINRDSIIYEQGMPVMFFFVPCRHRYKEVEAQLSHERAYFVGVRQIAFSRERYTVANDTNRYVETMGDAVNMELTDFVRVEGGGYAVYQS